MPSWFAATFLAGAVACFGQTYTIHTFAGSELPGNIPAKIADLGRVGGVAVGPSGNVLIALPDLGVVLRMDASSGFLTLVAGSGTVGYSGDHGPALDAQLNHPNAVAVDREGNVYICDRYNNAIRKVSFGIISTVAGTGIAGFSGDGGPATSAELNSPVAIAVDDVANIYIADTLRVRKVSNGVITTVAGNGTYTGTGEGGRATGASISPNGIATDAAGNVYISGAGTVQKVSKEGIITTFVGNGILGFLSSPQGLDIDPTGSLYIADYGTIWKVSHGVISTVAGHGFAGFSGDGGPATKAEISAQSVAADAHGNVYFEDFNFRVRKVTAGIISTVSGGGRPIGDGGTATRAQLYEPSAVAVDAAGDVFITDRGDNLVRKVSRGRMSTVAGGGSALGDGGPATHAQLSFQLYFVGELDGAPGGLAVDKAGNLYIADTIDNRIRKVSKNGVITTVAGGGNLFDSNVPATDAFIDGPISVAVDDTGFYIGEGRGEIQKVSNGVITTLVEPISGNFIYHLASGLAAENGNIFVADYFGQLYELANGTTTAIAGGPLAGFSGDGGPATSAQLLHMEGVALDSAGNFYIADSGNNRIRRVSKGIITTIAGGGKAFGDDGQAVDAQLNVPSGVAVDAHGNVYVADLGNNRIRVLVPDTPKSGQEHH